jgi:hypothetical protein
LKGISSAAVGCDGLSALLLLLLLLLLRLLLTGVYGNWDGDWVDER